MASACKAVRAREALALAADTRLAAWDTFCSRACTFNWSASYCSLSAASWRPRSCIRDASALACALRSEISSADARGTARPEANVIVQTTPTTGRACRRKIHVHVVTTDGYLRPTDSPQASLCGRAWTRTTGSGAVTR